MVSGHINTVSSLCDNLTGKGGNKLSLTELEYLKANTKYDEGDIREWYRWSHNICQFFMGSTILIFYRTQVSLGSGLWVPVYLPTSLQELCES